MFTSSTDVLFDEILEFLASAPSSQEIIDHQPPAALQEIKQVENCFLTTIATHARPRRAGAPLPFCGQHQGENGAPSFVLRGRTVPVCAARRDESR